MMPIKTYKNIETIVLYFVITKNLEISFQNGPKHETAFLRKNILLQKFFKNLPEKFVSCF